MTNERSQMWPYRPTTIAAAVLFAALAPALVVACFGFPIRFLPFALIVTLAHTVVLGLPCFLVLEGMRGVTVTSAIKAGGAIGAAPWGVLGLSALGNTYVLTDAAEVNAALTLAGWLSYLQSLLLCGALGGLAGLVFWLTLKWCGGRAPPAETTGLRHKRYAQIPSSVGALALAVLLTSGVFAIPVITKDRTCHNMFRDGRTSVGPHVNMYVMMGTEDWPKLTEVFEHFAEGHDMSMRNSSRDQAGVVRVLALSLCTEQGANIETADQRWASKNFESLYGWGTHIGVYELHENSGWQRLAGDLLAEVEAAWPGKVALRDGRGHVIPTPKELQNGHGEP